MSSTPASHNITQFVQVVPWQSSEFYSKIMQQGKKQGMVAFEVDYEVTDGYSFSQFRQNVSWASDWLTGMATAAARVQVPILCKDLDTCPALSAPLSLSHAIIRACCVGSFTPIRSHSLRISLPQTA